MQSYNWVDYIFIAIFAFSALAGFGRGFVREVVSVVTLIAAFVVATMFSNALALKFTTSPGVQTVVNQASSAIGVNTAQPVSYMAIGLSFGLLFAGTVIVGSLIGFFLNIAVSTGMLGMGNRLLGAGFGIARGFIINLVLIFVVQLTPISAEAWWGQSSLVHSYQPAVVWLGNIVSPSLADLKTKMTQTLQNVGGSLQNMTNSIPSL